MNMKVTDGFETIRGSQICVSYHSFLHFSSCQSSTLSYVDNFLRFIIDKFMWEFLFNTKYNDIIFSITHMCLIWSLFTELTHKSICCIALPVCILPSFYIFFNFFWYMMMIKDDHRQKNHKHTNQNFWHFISKNCKSEMDFLVKKNPEYK